MYRLRTKPSTIANIGRPQSGTDNENTERDRLSSRVFYKENIFARLKDS